MLLKRTYQPIKVSLTNGHVEEKTIYFTSVGFGVNSVYAALTLYLQVAKRLLFPYNRRFGVKAGFTGMVSNLELGLSLFM